MVRQNIVERKVGKGTFLKSLPVAEEQSEWVAGAGGTVTMLSCMSWGAMHRDAYFGEIVRHMDQVLSTNGHALAVLPNVRGDRLDQIIEDIQRQKPIALILPYADQFDDAFFARLTTLGLPQMLIGHPRPRFAGAQVYFDDKAGGEIAADYLLGKSHRQVAVIGAPVGSPAGVLRCTAFQQKFVAGGGEVVGCFPSSHGYDELDGYEAMGKLLEQWQAPSAVFCASDLLAYGSIKRLEKQGVQVPRDVAVFGYGAFRCESLYHPNLTTVKMDINLFAVEVENWLDEIGRLRTGEPAPSFEHVVPVELVSGDTA